MRNNLWAVLSVLLFSLLASESFAQGHKSSGTIYSSRVDNAILHYGYSVGVGVFDYRILNTGYGGDAGFLAEQVAFSPALRLGVIGEWNITNHISLRTIPGLYFGKRTVTFNRKELPEGVTNVFDDLGYPKQIDSELTSFYADIPLLFKYRGERINNYNFYLVVGASYHMDLSSHDEIDMNANEYLRTNRHDVALDFGGGMDFYFKYFKVGAELRISIGLIDVLNHNLVEDMPKSHVYTKSIGSMKSTLVTLSFNFE